MAVYPCVPIPVCTYVCQCYWSLCGMKCAVDGSISSFMLGDVDGGSNLFAAHQGLALCIAKILNSRYLVCQLWSVLLCYTKIWYGTICFTVAYQDLVWSDTCYCVMHTRIWYDRIERQRCVTVSYQDLVWSDRCFRLTRQWYGAVPEWTLNIHLKAISTCHALFDFSFLTETVGCVTVSHVQNAWLRAVTVDIVQHLGESRSLAKNTDSVARSEFQAQAVNKKASVAWTRKKTYPSTESAFFPVVVNPIVVF